MTVKVLNSREEAFCTAYVADPKRNGTAAAIAAGYSPTSAHVTASRMLRRAKVRARIAELEAFAAEHARMTIADVIDRYTAIVRADPNDLVSCKVGACRYCHGVGHAWQWRTRAEYDRALAAWHACPPEERAPRPPSDEGGFGYSRRRDPDPACPECDGDGEVRLVVHDTRTDHPLFAGLRQTRYGPEIRLHDKLAALDALARILGAYDKANRTKARGDGLGDFLVRLIRENRTQGIVLNHGERETS